MVRCVNMLYPPLLLFIGLKWQLAKIHNSSFNITLSARNLGLIFWWTPYLRWSDLGNVKILGLIAIRIRELRCIRPYLDFHRHPPLSILNLTIVILSIQMSKLIGSSSFKTLLLVLYLRLAGPLISLHSTSVFTIGRLKPCPLTCEKSRIGQKCIVCSRCTRSI